MLDLAISIDTDATGNTLIETNKGTQLKALEWPRDCEAQLVAFDSSRSICEVVCPESLADDIRLALRALKGKSKFKGEKPDWYRRLSLYAEDVAY